jgi:Arc/MetJ-type ribon-helix-helix transcriptional regulator
MTSTIQVNLPEQLCSQAKKLVEDGWAANLDALVGEALRRYLESHGPALTEAFVREDVAWGLNGRE